ASRGGARVRAHALFPRRGDGRASTVLTLRSPFTPAVAGALARRVQKPREHQRLGAPRAPVRALPSRRAGRDRRRGSEHARRAQGALAFVRTRSFRAEETAGRRLYSRYDRRSPRPLREHWLGESRNPGNTSVWAHRGRLFALCPAGVPVEIAAEDLSTLGEH